MVEGFLPHVLELWDMAIQAVLQLELESGTKWINQPIAHMESPQLASLHPGKLNPSLYSLHTSVRESKVPKADLQVADRKASRCATSFSE